MGVPVSDGLCYLGVGRSSIIPAWLLHDNYKVYHNITYSKSRVLIIEAATQSPYQAAKGRDRAPQDPLRPESL